MTNDQLAKLIEKTARAMKLPLVKLVEIGPERSLDMRVQRPTPSGPPVESQVQCEIQEDGGMLLGKATVKLSEVCNLPEDEAVRIIRVRLFEAAEEGGVEGI